MSFQGLPFDNKKQAVNEMKELGFSDGEANEVAEMVIQEAEYDIENAKLLYDNLKEDAEAIFSDLGLETFSFVGNPSQPSKFVMAKDAEDGFKSTSPILKDKDLDEEFEVVYAPVMQPSAVDKDGEVIPTEVIKESAHDFLAAGKTDQIDANHELITGKGDLVESWILKEDKTYDLPESYDDDEFTVPKGSWMVGVEPTSEIKTKIRSGEFTGFSIFGEAERIELRNSFKTKEYQGKDIEDKSMSEENEEAEEYGLKDVAEGVETLKEELSGLTETVEEIKSEEEEEEASVKEVSSFEDLSEVIGEEKVTLSFTDDFQIYSEKEDPCWDGYEQVGMKPDPNGEGEVPNCVPKSQKEDGMMEVVGNLAEMTDMTEEDICDALGIDMDSYDMDGGHMDEDGEHMDEDMEHGEKEEEEDVEAKGKDVSASYKDSQAEKDTSKSLSFKDAARAKVEG